MKRVIKEIIDIEHRAKDIITSTNEEIALKRTDMMKQLDEIHAQLLKESKDKIEYLRNRDKDTVVDDVGDDFEKQMAAMDSKIEKNLENWSNYLYELVIGDTDEKNS